MNRIVDFTRICLVFFLVSIAIPVAAQDYLSSNEGYIHFKSEAPLELIEASADKLKGVINPEEHTFAFSIEIAQLNGFNSALQREHFNENYMESHKFPTANFSGKFIEKIDFEQEGKYKVRAKGVLNIHGVAMERIIKGEIVVKENMIEIQSEFTVLLEDHSISVPKIVFNKIAKLIDVTVQIQLTKQ
jgi:polyisoprenoid-binding protein YceI